MDSYTDPVDTRPLPRPTHRLSVRHWPGRRRYKRPAFEPPYHDARHRPS